MRDAVALLLAAAFDWAVVALSRQGPCQQNRGANGKNQGAPAASARFRVDFRVDPAKASDRLNKVRDLTKEPLAAPRWRPWCPWRLWRCLTLTLAGLTAALPCGAGPTIVALPDGRQFGAAGDLAYVQDMPLGAAVGSRWQVYAPSGASQEDRRGGEALPRLPPGAPTQSLGTVELMSGPGAPDGIAIVTVVSSVREVIPGSVLLPLPAGQPGVE